MTATVGQHNALELAALGGLYRGPVRPSGSDAGAKRLMISLHRHLTAGEPTFVALAKGQERLSPRDYGQTGFVCLANAAGSRGRRR